MVDYTKMGLSPGIHFYQGDKHIKSISGADVYGASWVNDGRNVDVFSLFASEVWLYTALMKRRSYIRQIPMTYTMGGEPIDDQSIAGISLDNIARIDMTIQLYGWCFYHKEREMGGDVSFRYLSPRFMIPDEATAHASGYGSYWYTSDEISMDSGVRISEDDLLIFREDGIRESRPMVPAGQSAYTSSSTVFGLTATMKAFYDTNGLPVVAVIVPPETTPDEAQAMKSRFQELFQTFRSRWGNKTIGLTGDVKIQTISFTPKDLDMGGLSDSQIDAILSANEVPVALVHREVNRAEAELKQIEFLQTLAARANLIARQLSEDEDWQRVSNGAELAINLARHEALQKQNLEAAEAITRLTGRPILTVNEGREWLELDPLPESELQEAVRESYSTDREVNVEPKSQGWKDDAGQFRRWIKNRKNPDPDQFESLYLTMSDKLKIMQSVNGGGAAVDAPFWGDY